MESRSRPRYVFRIILFSVGFVACLFEHNNALAQTHESVFEILHSEAPNKNGELLFVSLRLGLQLESLLNEPLVSTRVSWNFGEPQKARIQIVPLDPNQPAEPRLTDIDLRTIPTDVVSKIRLMSTTKFIVRLKSNVLDGNKRREWIGLVRVSADTIGKAGSGFADALSKSSPNWNQLFGQDECVASLPCDMNYYSANESKRALKGNLRIVDAWIEEARYDFSAIRNYYLVRRQQNVQSQEGTHQSKKEQTINSNGAFTGLNYENHQLADKRAVINLSLFERENNTASSPGKKPLELQSDKGEIQSNTNQPVGSILILIDASGSMSGSKIEEAKRGAIQAARKAIEQNLEVAVLAFSGSCDGSTPQQLGFSQSIQQVDSFVRQIDAGGGTPLSPALKHAAKYLSQNSAPSSTNKLVILLADGQNKCGEIRESLRALKEQQLLFRHETIGLQVEGAARDDLQRIADQSNGRYRNLSQSKDVAQALVDTIDTIGLIEMLGKFNANTSRVDSSIAPAKSPALNMSDW